MNQKISLVYVLIAYLLTLHINSAEAQISKTEKGMDEMWGDSEVCQDPKLYERSRLFDNSNYGMFIHWGLYSHLGGKWKDKTWYGIGEWIMHPRMAGITPEEYKTESCEFNPVDFDAKAIVDLAKSAGMKYIIITSKHHDGFAMFHTSADSFNIVDATPFARDPIKELSVACRQAGLGFGFYYSHNQDWTAPGGTGGPKENADGTPAAFEDYFYRKCLPQVKEICTQYGQIDFVWFDTPGNMKKELVVELVKVVRELQPNAMLCSRVGHGMGDYASKGDMEVPLRNIPGLWETCDTNNDSWSYAWYDTNFKSPKELLNRLVSTVARGGTYLLNVGPDGKGLVPDAEANFLKETGDWINRYPRVIYQAGSSPWGSAMPWGDVTTNDNSLYLTVFHWPIDGKLYLPGLNSIPQEASLLLPDGKERISYSRNSGWTVFELPVAPADNPASVIELKFPIKAREITADTLRGIAPNAASALPVEFAHVEGAEKKQVRWMEKFGEWKHVTQISDWNDKASVVWEVNVLEPGPYYVDIRYRGTGRIVWKVQTDEGHMVQNQQAATEKYTDYPFGILHFEKPGKRTLTVSLVEGNPGQTSLEMITFTPAKVR